MYIGIVSGYFNPLHKGHIEYIKASKLRCEKLVVIINNDKQVLLKNSIPFMDENHRKYIVENLKDVDEVVISIDAGKDVSHTLEKLAIQYKNHNISFFNSGDRKHENLDVYETLMCKKYGIKEVVLDLPKLYSSSTLLESVKNK